MEYKECRKKDLVRDFEDYIAYLDELLRAGEFHGSILLTQVPGELLEAERVFCSVECVATRWTAGHCFLRNSDKRRMFQKFERNAELEAKDRPYCARAWDGMVERNIADKSLPDAVNYNWRKSRKYQDWINDRKFPEGGDTLWETL